MSSVFNVQQESQAVFKAEAVITQHLSSNTLIVYLTLLSFLCMCVYFEVLNVLRKKLLVFEKGNSPAIV